MLTDGASALLNAVVLIVRDRRPNDAADVNPAIRVEGSVLGGQRCLYHPGRDVIERYHNPVVALLAVVGQQRAVAVVDERALLQRVGGETAARGLPASRLGGGRGH